MITGKKLNIDWKVNAKHALYRKDGTWYHLLKDFPGALFDKNGYVFFNTRNDYLNSKHLQIKKEIHVPNGISTIPQYIKIK